jgi:hypothetical protein
MWRDANAGTVERAEGAVRWSGVRYVAEVGSVRLAYVRPAVSAGVVEGPAPGAYHVYFTPRSRVVVAVEPVSAATPVPTDSLQRVLERVFSCPTQVLTQCRAGRLERRSRRRLVWMIATRALGIGLLASWVASDWSRLRVEAAWLAVVVIACAFAAFHLASQIVALWSDLRDGAVLSVEGRLHKRYRAPRISALRPEYQVLVGLESMPWRVDRRGFMALIDGLDYRIFFTPRGRVVVGIEPLASRR